MFNLSVGACAAPMSGEGPLDTKTATGIAIDSEWKKSLYAYAQKNVIHPAWGIAHSERDYQLAKSLATAEGFAIDPDVLFAAAFLHDLGGIGTFARNGVDHAVRSVELAEPLLRSWGFPMQKWAEVKDLILGHTYYSPAPMRPASLAFRDADLLDFLGSIGIARILAVTEEAGRGSLTLKNPFDTLRSFQATLPGKLSLKASHPEGAIRIEQMRSFFREVDRASFGGAAL